LNFTLFFNNVNILDLHVIVDRRSAGLNKAVEHLFVHLEQGYMFDLASTCLD